MDSHFRDVFKFCPTCGARSESVGNIPFICTKCGFHFYFPPTIAVGAIIADEQGQVLFIERARDPGKGKLGLPGGFVDPGETGELAVAREIQEEVGLITTELKFLATFPNTYHYRGVISDILDIFYVCQINSWDELKVEESEVASYRLATPCEEIYQQMAFESNQKAVKLFAEQNSL